MCTVFFVGGAVKVFFAKPPQLPNVGNTCYLNATLQNFYNCSLLTDMILLKKIKIQDVQNNDKHFFQGYEKVIKAMYQAQGGRVTEEILKNLADLGCERRSLLFGQEILAGQQQDPTEFVVDPVLNVLPWQAKVLFEFAQSSAIGCPYKSDLKKDVLGVLSKKVESFLFLQTEIKGSSLESSLINYFDLERLTENNRYKYDAEHLEEKESYYKEVERLFDIIKPEGTIKGLFIKNCQKRYRMKTFPTYLIIQLKRFSYNDYGMGQRINSKVSIPLTLDMTPYADESGGKQEYSLIGAVLHSGYLGAGHYRAYIKDQFDEHQSWYVCDDATVTQITSLDDLSLQGYVFFYVRSDKVEQIQQDVQKRSAISQEIIQGIQSQSVGSKSLDALGNALASMR